MNNYFKDMLEDVSCPSCKSKDIIKMGATDVTHTYVCTSCDWSGVFVKRRLTENDLALESLKAFDEALSVIDYVFCRTNMTSEQKQKLEGALEAYSKAKNAEIAAKDKKICAAIVELQPQKES